MRGRARQDTEEKQAVLHRARMTKGGDGGFRGGAVGVAYRVSKKNLSVYDCVTTQLFTYDFIHIVLDYCILISLGRRSNQLTRG